MAQIRVRDLQRLMNRFVKSRLRGIGPILVDGKVGPGTRGRIRTIKFYLGYNRKNCNGAVDAELIWRLRHPYRIRRNNRWDRQRVLRSKQRCTKQRRAARANERKAHTSGASTYDGIVVAEWFIPYMQWARSHGWRGRLVSGYRTPAYSESLCFRMCGRPSCPGRCAGRASNHAHKDKPEGAIDVSDFHTFGQLMRNCPRSPRIFNALGAQDPVHFSFSGR